MKYLKKMTLKEWERFKKPLKDSLGEFVQPGNEFQFINFSTGKKESLQTITGQELLLHKYKVVLTDYETKWVRRYHKVSKHVNQKNLDKGLKTLDKIVGSFSNGSGSNGKGKRGKGKRGKSRDIEKEMGDLLSLGGGGGNRSNNGIKIWSTETQRKPKRTKSKKSKTGSRKIQQDEINLKKIWG